jgi:hypothetical protein
MHKTLRFALGIISLVACATVASAQTSPGEQAERRMWEAIKAKNWTAVDAMIAPGFQSAHEDGARDKAGEMTLMRALDITDYTITDVKVTDSGTDLMIVTYRISVPETIDGKQLSSKPAMRMSVWQKTTAGWQWISHVNLRAL